MDDYSFTRFINRILIQTSRLEFLRYKYNRKFIQDLIDILIIEMSDKQKGIYNSMFKPLLDIRLNKSEEKEDSFMKEVRKKKGFDT